MECNLCPNRYKKYFKCDSVIQMDLFSFAEENNFLIIEPDSLVLELLRILCEKR